MPITVQELRACLHEADAGEAPQATHARTVRLGSHIHVLFESRTTLLSRLVRQASIEGISDEAALQAECDVYNDWLCADQVCVTLRIDPMPQENWQALAEALQVAFYLDIGAERVTAQWVGPLGQESQGVFLLDSRLRAAVADVSQAMAVGVAHRNATLWANIKGELRAALATEAS